MHAANWVRQRGTRAPADRPRHLDDSLLVIDTRIAPGVPGARGIMAGRRVPPCRPAPV